MGLHGKIESDFVKEGQWNLNTDTGIEILAGVTVSDGECKTYTLGYKGDAHGIVNAKCNVKGKEYFLRSLITSSCFRHAPEYLELQVIQCKVTESMAQAAMSDYGVNFPQIVSLSLGESASNDAVRQLCATAKARYEKLIRLGYKDTLSYNKDVSISSFKLGIMPRRLVIINAADVLFERNDEEIVNNLAYLCKIGRAVGIHIIYVFDSFDSITGDMTMNGLFNQCSLRFSLCSDVEVECKGAADETSVLCNMPLWGPKNTRDLAKSMWKLLEFDNSSI